MTPDLKSSFTAVETTPVKLFMNPGAKNLRPVHINWMPTNRCNLNCPFCSCSKRDKQQEMSIDLAIEVIGRFHWLGCRAVTITGGGEPLCHPHLERMLLEFSYLGIKIGLVTNGTLFDSLPTGAIALLTWCRVSNADNRRFTSDYKKVLDRVVEVPIDWAFSHVVGKKPNLDEIDKIVDYAVDRQFTHVRLVSDLLNPGSVPLDLVRSHLKGRDSLVIYQARKRFVPSNSCLIGYVKPIIAPSFKMYLCCGVQYARENMDKSMPESLCMGDARRLDEVYSNGKPFDVSCSRCYYDEYNSNLAVITRGIRHVEFL